MKNNLILNKKQDSLQKIILHPEPFHSKQSHYL